MDTVGVTVGYGRQEQQPLLVRNRVSGEGELLLERYGEATAGSRCGTRDEQIDL